MAREVLTYCARWPTVEKKELSLFTGKYKKKHISCERADQEREHCVGKRRNTKASPIGIPKMVDTQWKSRAIYAPISYGKWVFGVAMDGIDTAEYDDVHTQNTENMKAGKTQASEKT